MSNETLVCSPGPRPGTVRTADGRVLTPPKEWELLPPGDAGLTRRVKAAGPTWTVQEKKGRKLFSKGVWAPAKTIAQMRADLDAERSTESYAKKRASDEARRHKKEEEYSEDFTQAVFQFLDFSPIYRHVAEKLARAVATHATPVGSGTVARTKRIPIEERAEAAVIAWLRHQTTTYDSMKIARVKGERREVRRMLAEQSRKLLSKYRNGIKIQGDACPLYRALYLRGDSRTGS